MREVYQSKLRAQTAAKKASNHLRSYVVFPCEGGWSLVRCRPGEVDKMRMQSFFAEREQVHTGHVRLHQAGRRRIPVAWSPEEVRALKQMRKENKTWAEIAEALHRRRSSVVQKFRSFDIQRPTKYKTWPAEEVEDLRELRGEGRGWAEIARIMGRERRSVVNKAKAEGLE